MSKKKKVGIAMGIIGAVIVFVVVALARQGQNTGAADKAETYYVQTGTVEKEPIESVIYTKGDVVAEASVAIVPEVPGTVETVFVSVGDAVKKGDPILKLETATIEKSIRDAKLQLDIAQTNYSNSVSLSSQENSAQANRQASSVRNAKLVYENALKSYEEASALFEAGIISAKEKDAAKLSYDQAYNAYVDAQNDQTVKTDTVKVNALQLESTRNAYNDLVAEKEKYTLRAPIDGVVTTLDVAAYDTVMQTSQAATVETVSDLKIKTYIGEYDIASIAVGMPVRITGNAVGDEVYDGEISEVGASAVVQGQERSVPVTVKLSGETAFKPNFTADLEIVFARSEEALTIPYEAWAKRDGKDYVYTVKDGKAVQNEVTVGVIGDIRIEVIGEGIDADSVLILKPQATLEDGSPVKVIGGE